MDDIYPPRRPGAATQFDPADPRGQAINPPTLFDGSALFSQIIVAPRGRTVWIAGLIGVTPDNRLVAGGKTAQLRQAFVNIRAAIAAASCSPADCVRLTEYIVDYRQADLVPLRDEIQELFPSAALPTNIVVPVARLGRDDALIEVELVCVLPD